MRMLRPQIGTVVSKQPLPAQRSNEPAIFAPDDV